MELRSLHRRAMISCHASSPFTDLKFRKISPLAQRRGLSLQFYRFGNLSYNNSKICLPTITASNLLHNLGTIDPEVSSNSSSEKYLLSEAVDSVDTSILFWTNISKKLGALYEFTRPYGIYGTIIVIISMSVLPIQSLSDLSPAFFFRLLQTMIPALLVNVYVTGINQISDVEIDKINKPFLPLASGDLSLTEATAATSFSIVISFAFAAMMNSLPLSIAILTIFFLSTAYSVDVPLLRWKKTTALSALCITVVGGLVYPLLFFAHAQMYILGRPLVYTKTVFFIASFMTSFFTVISVIKDVPDVEGDKAFGLRSPSVIYGVKKVFWSSVYMLLATYGAAAVFGTTSTFLPTKIITVLGHGIIATILWGRAKSTNVADPTDTFSFYLFIWQLSYVEYFLIPFIRF